MCVCVCVSEIHCDINTSILTHICIPIVYHYSNMPLSFFWFQIQNDFISIEEKEEFISRLTSVSDALNSPIDGASGGGSPER